MCRRGEPATTHHKASGSDPVIRVDPESWTSDLLFCGSWGWRSEPGSKSVGGDGGGGGRAEARWPETRADSDGWMVIIG